MIGCLCLVLNQFNTIFIWEANEAHPIKMTAWAENTSHTTGQDTQFL